MKVWPIVLVVLVIIVWRIWKLGGPWRKYHRQHIAPLESEIKSTEASRDKTLQDLRQAEADAELFSRDIPAEIRQFRSAN